MDTNMIKLKLEEIEMVTGGYLSRYLRKLNQYKDQENQTAGGATGDWEAGGATGGWGGGGASGRW